MPVYHIVLFRLKPTVSQESLVEFSAKVRSMMGKIPGLLKIDINRPLPATAHRSKGYDVGVVAILEKPEDVAVYASHPAHLEVHEIRQRLCDDSLAYDLEFPA
ncbi:hypothetical protein F4779DRAFT_514865 [Xylariaceae sp. FL0662B]|nr:hypothetical protein F4779DRAFT_514865 [Xylariaceae sp. FL0662B]